MCPLDIKAGIAIETNHKPITVTINSDQPKEEVCKVLKQQRWILVRKYESGTDNSEAPRKTWRNDNNEQQQYDEWKSCIQNILDNTCITRTNKRFELMLTGRAKAYSSSYPQAVTHRSTNRARRKVTSFQPKRVNNYATPPTPVPWRRLVNDIDLSRPKAPKKSIKPPILAFKVIQGH